MFPCPRCATHVRATDDRCVHCGERLAGRGALRSTAAAALLGLAVACTGDAKSDSAHTGTPSTTDVQPLYGVTTTDVVSDTDTDVDADTDADADTDTDTTGGTGGGGSGGGTTGGSGTSSGSGASGSGGGTVDPLYGVTTTY